MDENVDRRNFAKRTSAVVGGLLSAGLLTEEPTFGCSADESRNRLMLLGLNGLARAHELNYFTDGHRAASLVAAHLMCHQNNFDKRARLRIVQLFDLNWASSPLCRPFPEEEPDPDAVSKVGEALAEGGEVLRQVGHNAIFAMLAIKGFRMLPSAATPQRIAGVCRLIRSFTPWRDVDPDRDVDPPPFGDFTAASRYVLREASEAVDRFVGFGQGFAGHMLTFGQALIELSHMGDHEWADSCRTAFCKYVTVTRQGPEPGARRIADHKPSKLQPADAAYWEARGDRALGIGHVFKYPYSYYDLLKHADDPALAREWNAKAYHVF